MTRILLSALAAFLFAGCSSAPVAPPPADIVATLAPTGKLRVGVYPGSPSSMIVDAKTGETRGLSYELGAELARRLHVPFEPVVYARVAEVLGGLKAGQVDVTITNATPARANDMDFSPTLMEVELGYLVPQGSRVSTQAGIDQPGIRVGVSQGGTSHATLTREMKLASVVPAPSVKAAIEMLTAGTVDVFATNKGVLFEIADQLPGSKVMDGRWGIEHFAFAVPKGREKGAAFLRAFAEDVKAKGLLRRAVERAGLRGAAQ
jgi:polar amino acid transport system substrate-binding protein